MTTITATRHMFDRTGWVLAPLRWIAAAFAAHRQRLRLEDLDPHLLADIGIDRATACAESHRPFWDLPR